MDVTRNVLERLAKALVMAQAEELLPQRFLEDLRENLAEAAGGLEKFGDPLPGSLLLEFVYVIQRQQERTEGSSYDA